MDDVDGRLNLGFTRAPRSSGADDDVDRRSRRRDAASTDDAIGGASTGDDVDAASTGDDIGGGDGERAM